MTFKAQAQAIPFGDFAVMRDLIIDLAEFIDALTPEHTTEQSETDTPEGKN